MSYPEFEYNPLHSSASEFQRMRRFYRWKRDNINEQGAKAWEAYRMALVKEFNRLFGTDEHDLLAWQTLCTFVGVRRSSTGFSTATCDDCCEVLLKINGALQTVHFNLVGVIDAHRLGDAAARVFPTAEALLEYTRRTVSYFPRGNRKAGTLLKRLLRRPRKDIAVYPMYDPLRPTPPKTGK
ncbi:hypothetical protein MMC26_005410 [Xylographa opegraphella]|nr:hypothetical protein [Xylographa opegraphella]